MKKFLHIAGIIFFLLFLATLLYIIILSQHVVIALALVVLLNIFVIITIGASVLGIMKRKKTIAILNTKKHINSIFLLVIATFFLCHINLLAVLNVAFSKRTIEELPSLKKSADTFINIFVPVPYNDNLLTEEFDGITFYFPQEDPTIQGIKNMYSQAKDKLDNMYGENTSMGLTVIIYDDMKELQAQSNIKGLTGLYVSSNESIHLPSAKLIGLDRLQEIFFHEYTHFRTKHFMREHRITDKSIPQWFDEGISEMMENLNNPIHANLEKIIDFTAIHTNEQFHKAQYNNFRPYLQSYFAVKELVNEHGLEIIPNLILAAKEKDFYVAFQEITNTHIEDFQVTFLDRNNLVKKLLAKADNAERKQQYQKAERLYVEILNLDPYSASANQNLPYIYIKQGKFEEALEKLKEDRINNYRTMSELSLLSNQTEALKYAEKAEEEIKLNLGHDYYPTSYIVTIRKIFSDTISGYQQLFDENLISCNEIQTELVKRLKQRYPDEQWLQALKA